MWVARALQWLIHESGMRFLARRKAAFAVAVLTMGLALGANTLAYSATRAFLFSSFGLPAADRLFVIAPVRELPGRGEVVFADAYPNYERIRATQRVFADVGCILQTVASWDHKGDAVPLQAARVTSSFFSTVRVSPVMGRAFTEQEEGPSPASVVVISHGLWRGPLAGDPAVVGRTLVINGSAHTVIGVMPAGFTHPLPRTEIWLPFDIQPQWRTAITGARTLTIYGRLKDGMSEAAAAPEADALTRQAIEASPNNRDFRTSFQSVRQVLLPGADRTLLFVQAAAVVLVILAISNLGSLLIAWGFERRQELAVRLAIGAGGGRIVRMLVLQSLVVVTAGGITGALLARLTLPAIRQFELSPALAIFIQRMKLDAGVLVWSALAVAAAGLVAGLVPAWFAGRVPLSDALRASARSSSLSPAAIRWQKAMVCVQAALSVVIVSAAALIAVSFRKLSEIPDGLSAQQRLVTRVQLPPDSYATHELRTGFATSLLESLERERDLVAFGFTSTLPVGDIPTGSQFFPEPPDAANTVEPLLFHFRRVSPTYLATMHIPLLRGRAIMPRDDASQPLVVILSQAAAERLWPKQDAIGKRLFRRAGNNPPQEVQVIGVAGNVMDAGYSAPPGEAAYMPFAQISVGQLSLVVESHQDAERTLAAVRRALRATDPTLAANNTVALAALVEQANALPRLQTVLLLVFATVASAMVILGSYGVMSQLVAAREREFALRLLFGAAPAGLGFSVLLGVARLSSAGVVIGSIAVLALNGVLQPFVFGIAPRSASVLLLVSAGVLALAAASALPPATRAMRLDPRKGVAAG